eukprot:scaffold9459_cov45-Attheya_sp.AAC.3
MAGELGRHHYWFACYHHLREIEVPVVVDDDACCSTMTERALSYLALVFRRRRRRHCPCCRPGEELSDNDWCRGVPVSAVESVNTV